METNNFYMNWNGILTHEQIPALNNEIWYDFDNILRFFSGKSYPDIILN